MEVSPIVHWLRWWWWASNNHWKSEDNSSAACCCNISWWCNASFTSKNSSEKQMQVSAQGLILWLEFPINIYYIPIPIRRTQVETRLFFNDVTQGNKQVHARFHSNANGSKSSVPTVCPVALSHSQKWFDVIFQAENTWHWQWIYPPEN